MLHLVSVKFIDSIVVCTLQLLFEAIVFWSCHTHTHTHIHTHIYIYIYIYMYIYIYIYCTYMNFIRIFLHALLNVVFGIFQFVHKTLLLSIYFSICL